MQMIHNNYCTKSLCALDLVKEKELSVELVDYMKNPLTKEQIADLLRKLGMSAFDLVRKSEPVYAKKFEGKNLSEEEWIDAMVHHPILIERPIFINGEKAVIGRPAERVFEIL
jgi:arsenate reductase (glutaredoxin)